ncbi:MAG: type I-B CRISPR-associated protein Cas5, partial [Candidatus Zixiibacteriota bacterium]
MDNDLFQLDKVLIFDLTGPFAHFRKFYTNSSSLSYTVPSRTVLTGLIAGLLGMPSEHHTTDKSKIYYEKFNSENCFISVSLRSPIRKIMQTVNYYNTNFQNYSLRYQIPLEILTPIKNNEIVYRIYFSHGKDIYDDLKERLLNKKFVYPPFLGISEFIASLEFIDEGDLILLPDTTEIHSVCKLNFVEEFNNNEQFQYLTEKMPTSFSNERVPEKPNDYVIEMKGNPI